MAFTTNLYNHTAKKVLGGEIDWSTAKVMLLNSGGTFTATHTTVDQVAGAASPHRANEVYGNGWTEGGVAIASIASSIATTNDANLAGTDVRVRAAGGSIGPATALLIFVGTAPLIHVDFGGSLSAGDGTDFLIPMSAIMTASYA
jgi:hypothetical protein